MDILQLMLRGHVALENSSGIFVFVEIMRMYTIHKYNHPVMTEPRNGKSNTNTKLRKFSCKSTDKFFFWFVKPIFRDPKSAFCGPFFGRYP